MRRRQAVGKVQAGSGGDGTAAEPPCLPPTHAIRTEGPRPGLQPTSVLRALAAALLVLALGRILGRTAETWAGGWSEGWIGYGAGPPAHASPARVLAVIDGDTLVIEGGEHVRLLGIDTPETHHPGMRGPQALGPEAALRLEALVAGRQVRLEADRQDRDHYGRLLRHVWIGRRLVAQILAREGLAHVLIIPPNQGHAERLREAAATAQARNRGLWGLARPTPLPLFRLMPPAMNPSGP